MDQKRCSWCGKLSEGFGVSKKHKDASNSEHWFHEMCWDEYQRWFNSDRGVQT